MNIHKNARLTPIRREEMALCVLEGRLSKAAAARAFGVTAKIVARWVERYKAQGRAGMYDRSSRPKTLRAPTPQAVIERIVAGFANAKTAARSRACCRHHIRKSCDSCHFYIRKS